MMSHGFSGFACDMTIEQTVNRDSKTRGGVKGFTTNKGSSSRWIRAHRERASITWQCKEMPRREKDKSRSRIGVTFRTLSAPC